MSHTLAYRKIPADGNCLYNAVIDQLSLRGKVRTKMRTQNVLIVQLLQEYTLSKLRSAVATFMRENPSEFMPFLDSEEDVTEGTSYSHSHLTMPSFFQ